MSEKSNMCELCGKPLAPYVMAGTSKRCAACLMRLGVIDLDLKKYLPAWRLEEGLRYVRWAVLPLPPTGALLWSDVGEQLDFFAEMPDQAFEITVCGKRQAILFFFDTFKL